VLEERFNSLGRFLKKTFGERVHRMNVNIAGKMPMGGDGLDGYLLSPGGTLDTPNSASDITDVTSQIENAKERTRKKFKYGKYIVHFHSPAGEFVSFEKLKSTVETVMRDNEIIGLNFTLGIESIDDRIRSYLHEISSYIYIWVETGIHTIHDETLKKIGAKFMHQESMDVIESLIAKNIRVAPSIVFGLPGESDEMMHATMDKISKLLVNGISIQNFFALTGSPFEEDLNNGNLKPISLDEYVSLVCDFIEIIPPHIVLRRIIGEASNDMLIAPQWMKKKMDALNAITKEMDKRGSSQGSKSPYYFAVEQGDEVKKELEEALVSSQDDELFDE